MSMSSKTVEDMEDNERISPGVLSWVEELRQVSLAVSKKTTKSSASRNQLFYLLHWTDDLSGFGVILHKGREAAGAEEWWAIDRALIKPPPFVSDEDVSILRLLWAERTYDSGLRAFGLGPRHGGEALQRMAQTGRLCSGND